MRVEGVAGGYTGINRHGRVWVRHNTFHSTRKVPGTNVSLFSRPDKMPGPSWSMPAGGPACPFKVTGHNTICGGCYVLSGGRYSANSTQRAQQARYDWASRCVRTPEGCDEFVAAMVAALRDINTPRHWYMRVHDSGDLFSEAYTRCWIRIAAAVPHIRFWFPTRSWRAPWVETIMALNALPNVTVRPSALHFDAPPPMIEGLAAGTSVASDGYTCPAPSQDNTCGDCRRCWDRPADPVVYHKITPVSRMVRRAAIVMPL